MPRAATAPRANPAPPSHVHPLHPLFNTRSLPRSLRIREAPVQAARRHALALLDSPAGWVASYYAAGGLVFSVGLAMHGAWQR